MCMDFRHIGFIGILPTHKLHIGWVHIISKAFPINSMQGWASYSPLEILFWFTVKVLLWGACFSFSVVGCEMRYKSHSIHFMFYPQWHQLMKFIYPNVIFLKGKLIYYGYISPLLVVWGVAFSNWLNIVKLTYLHMWLIGIMLSKLICWCWHRF